MKICCHENEILDLGWSLMTSLINEISSPPPLIPHYWSVCFIKCMDWDLAHRYAIFVSSLVVEIITNSPRSVQDYLVGQLTNWDWVLDWTLTQKFPAYDFF